MKKYIFPAVMALILVLFTACPSAPPIESTTGFEPYSAPLKPQNITASNGKKDTITLKWDEVEGATSYQIWGIVAEKYGTESKNATSATTYAKLIERGFLLIDVVTKPEYTLKGEKANSSYVFSVVAMKTTRSASQNDSVLYSEPSDFVQGGTVGEIIISAVANSKQVSIYWDISNLYSVINNTSEKKTLFDYNLYIFKKLSSESTWGEGELLGSDVLENQSYSYAATALDIDTQYDFKLRLEIIDGITIDSDAFTITTDSSLVPECVSDVTTNSGEKKGEVTLSWTIPELPERNDISSVFMIERSEDEGVTWTTVVDNLTVEAGSTSASYTDTALNDNVNYVYAIYNGYRIGDKSPIYQTRGDETRVKDVFSLWYPTDVTFSFVEADDKKSGTLTVNYKYNPPKTVGELKTYIGGTWRTESELNSHTNLSETEGTEYVVTKETESPLYYYSFYFNTKLELADGTTFDLMRKDNPSDVTLGKTSETAGLITDFKATCNWVKTIRLSWDKKQLSGEKYEIYEDNKLLSGYEIQNSSDSTIKYVDLACEDGVTHNYRLKVLTAENQFSIVEAKGNTLAVPSGMEATDSTSIEEIKISWPVVDDKNVCYTLYSSSDKDTWTPLEYTREESGKTASASLPAAKDGSDGKPYYFKLEAYNSTQADQQKLTSDIEEGSVFGPALLDVKVPNSGKESNQITITWTEVKGAAYYRIKRDGGDYLVGTIKGTSYSDPAEKLANQKKSSTPLSEDYTYTVVPFMADGTEAVVPSGTAGASATGRLFAPPKNIQATKGKDVDKVTVTWDSVPYATGYEIERYVVSLINGNATTSGSPIDTVTVTGATTYEDMTSEIIAYRIRALGEVTIDDEHVAVVSVWQDGNETTTNTLGFDESSHIGYGVQSVSTLSVSTMYDGSYYASCAKITWSMAPGATSYRLYNNVNDEGITISVSDISKYSTTEVVTNGKNENEAGYLAYDPKTQMYSYNDNSGFMESTYIISGYKISAVNGTAVTETKGNDTPVYRQPTAEEWINIVSSILKPGFKAADEKWDGDWWLSYLIDDRGRKTTYSWAEGFNFHLEDSASKYNSEKNYLNLSSYYSTSTGLTLTTSENIRFDCKNNNASKYNADNSLTLIGNGGGKIDVATPSGLKNFTISYNKIGVSRGNYSGTYTVTMDGSSSQTIQDGERFVRVLE